MSYSLMDSVPGQSMIFGVHKEALRTGMKPSIRNPEGPHKLM